jgi:hypothetical protein
VVDEAASSVRADDDGKALVVRAGANDETRLDARAKKKVIVAGRRITIMMMPRKRDVGVVDRRWQHGYRRWGLSCDDQGRFFVDGSAASRLATKV